MAKPKQNKQPKENLPPGKLGSKGVLSDDNRSTAQFKENGIIYQGNNLEKRRVIRYQIDGDMINDRSQKCDNALEVPEKSTIYLIELKGSDVKKASEQIYSTIEKLNTKLNNCTVHGRIVCSRAPRPALKTTQIVRLQKRLAQLKGTLKTGTRKLEEEI